MNAGFDNKNVTKVLLQMIVLFQGRKELSDLKDDTKFDCHAIDASLEEMLLCKTEGGQRTVRF